MVSDEYGRVEPPRRVVLSPAGDYSVDVTLQASRLGSDQNGRRYRADGCSRRTSWETLDGQEWTSSCRTRRDGSVGALSFSRKNTRPRAPHLPARKLLRQDRRPSTTTDPRSFIGTRRAPSRLDQTVPGLGCWYIPRTRLRVSDAAELGLVSNRFIRAQRESTLVTRTVSRESGCPIERHRAMGPIRPAMLRPEDQVNPAAFIASLRPARRAQNVSTSSDQVRPNGYG